MEEKFEEVITENRQIIESIIPIDSDFLSEKAADIFKEKYEELQLKDKLLHQKREETHKLEKEVTELQKYIREREKWFNITYAKVTSRVHKSDNTQTGDAMQRFINK